MTGTMQLRKESLRNLKDIILEIKIANEVIEGSEFPHRMKKDAREYKKELTEGLDYIRDFLILLRAEEEEEETKGQQLKERWPNGFPWPANQEIKVDLIELGIDWFEGENGEIVKTITFKT